MKINFIPTCQPDMILEYNEWLHSIPSNETDPKQVLQT